MEETEPPSTFLQSAFLSLHCVRHICFVLSHLHRYTLDMYKHEREPSWSVAPCIGQRGKQKEIVGKWLSSVSVLMGAFFSQIVTACFFLNLAVNLVNKLN